MNYLLRRRKLGRTSCREIVAKSTTGIRAFRNDKRHWLQPAADDLVFRWGCTDNVAQGHIVNTSEAIHRVNDKTGFRRILQPEGLCPPTWFTEADVHYPCIVRPKRHHQGRRLFYVRDEQGLGAAIARCGVDWYASQYIDKVAEYRIFVVSGRVVCVARKRPNDAKGIAWNVAQGGHFENVRFDEWPLRAVRIGLNAWALSGLDFAGVDVMVDGEGACFVLEINSAPSLTSEYRQTQFAKAFDYIVAHGKAAIPLIEAKGDWKKFVHPAVSPGALLRA